MRVLPGCGKTAPRLPLEKSYSFFICTDLGGFRLAHRNDAHAFITIGVNDNAKLAQRVHANGHKALFALGGAVFDRYRQWIVEYASPSAKERPCLRRFSAFLSGRMCSP